MKKIMTSLIFCISLASVSAPAFSKAPGKEIEKKDKITSSLISGLKLRSIGPALTSGRISDFAVDPNDRSYFFVGVASGGVWKTTNGGVTFTPVFDDQKSFSIGCLAMDPTNRETIWVGSGENNSQRAVCWGDGIYKSTDGGSTWKNMGLAKSEHIGKIVIDPRNSNVVYVAAQGPLWGPGGDRGLYKTTDGGKNWTKSLDISENTGVTDIVMDSKNPDVLYCASYQRRRHVYTVIDGGPESVIYKSYNAGATWEKLTSGLPGAEMGKIGLAISQTNPDYIYATIEAAEGKGGFFRSTNRGASWQKRNDWVSGSAQYYQEIYCDPKNPEVVYAMDTYARKTEDGGKTFTMLSTKERHVDDHAFFIDPKNTKFVMIGGDGGMYESYDGGSTWRFFENLPVPQFYRVQADNAEPFYNVYGGTQDNNSFGGPARTTNAYGIFNSDWRFVVGGDGYEAQIDPKDPNIVYGQWQYGGLIRYDKKSGEQTGIKPQEEAGEELRFNWDTPILLSSFDNKRLYMGANKLFRSDDRGDTWKRISPDLTRQIKRDELKVMNKIWGPEAVAKNASTSHYGNLIAIAESPLNENLLYIGTDDGLIQVTEDGGKNWRKIDKFPGVPEFTYCTDIWESQHKEGLVYASFCNHKNADFKPYILKSEDKGVTWTSLVNGLPEDEPVWTITEDHVKPELLFCGTEFGLYCSINGGAKWVQMKGNLPSIPVKDLDIQRRESDLIVGTFGRGIYILDDYSPLRDLTEESLDKDATIFKIKDALMYFQDESYGHHSFGNTFYRGDNPEFGATFTYYLKESLKTKKALRIETEKKMREEGLTPSYPSFEQLRLEDLEEAPYIQFTISDAQGNVVRKLKTSGSSGLNRINWDLRYPESSPINANTNINTYSGFPVLPGKYSVTMYKVIDGIETKLSGPAEFTCKVLNNTVLPAQDRKALVDFQEQVMELQRAAIGTRSYLNELGKKIQEIQVALLAVKGETSELALKARACEMKFNDLDMQLNGDKSKSKRNENQTPDIAARIDNILSSMWASTSAPTQTSRDSYKIAYESTQRLINSVKKLVNEDLKSLETGLEEIKAPATQGRLPILK